MVGDFLGTWQKSLCKNPISQENINSLLSMYSKWPEPNWIVKLLSEGTGNEQKNY